MLRIVLMVTALGLSACSAPGYTDENGNRIHGM